MSVSKMQCRIKPQLPYGEAEAFLFLEKFFPIRNAK